MATDIHAGDIADMLNGSLPDLGKGRITDLTSVLQRYTALPRLMNKERLKFDTGRSIQFTVLTTTPGNARNVGLFAQDNLGQADGTEVGNVPWRHQTDGYHFDFRQALMNRSPAKIVDFVDTKRLQMLRDWAELHEANFWSEPSSSSDTLSPFGIRYWMVYNATAGFNGGNNTNFSGGPAGIDRDEVANWKNYTFQYTDALAQDDLFRKLRKAIWETDFQPSLTNSPIPAYGGKSQFGIYTTYDTESQIAELLESRNEQLGRKVDPMDGKAMLRSINIEAVPYLQQNDQTSDPIVGINWAVFHAISLKGAWMKPTPLKESPLSHVTLESHMDNTNNFVCHDCRRMFIGAKSTWH